MTTPVPRSPVAALEAILGEWLADPETMLVVGRWSEGSVAEILPRGRARLSRAGYSGRFAGLRDLEIEGSEHHMHLDLAKFQGVRYSVRPSVCFGWRPALEMDLVGVEETASFALAVGKTWLGNRLAREGAQAFFRRFRDHRGRFGDLVDFGVRASRAPVADVEEAWREIDACLWEAVGRERPEPFDPADPLRSMRDSMAAAAAEALGV